MSCQHSTSLPLIMLNFWLHDYILILTIPSHWVSSHDVLEIMCKRTCVSFLLHADNICLQLMKRPNRPNQHNYMYHIERRFFFRRAQSQQLVQHSFWLCLDRNSIYSAKHGKPINQHCSNRFFLCSSEEHV